MSIKKIEHIGIAVSNLDASEKLFTQLLGCEPYKREEVASEGVITSFFLLGDVKIELLAATHENSPIAKFIEKKGEGIHHIAFDTHQMNQTLQEKSAQGFQLINTTPKEGADGKNIAFLHPKSTNSVLVELCEDKNPTT